MCDVSNAYNSVALETIIVAPQVVIQKFSFVFSFPLFPPVQ